MRRLTLAAITALLACGCAGDDDEAAPATERTAATARCIVRLHGKGGTGADDVVNGDGVLEVSPEGNADGWGGRQWLYFPDDQLDAAIEIVRDAAAPCDEVIVNGFSNGGAFAAKLYCRGESLGGRLVRVVVDDPVPDAGVEGCAADPGVGLTVYWTGALSATAQPGWDCTDGDWTCEGGTTIGIDGYVAALDTEIVESAHDEHEWFRDAPALSDWTR